MKYWNKTFKKSPFCSTFLLIWYWLLRLLLLTEFLFLMCCILNLLSFYRCKKKMARNCLRQFYSIDLFWFFLCCRKPVSPISFVPKRYGAMPYSERISVWEFPNSQIINKYKQTMWHITLKLRLQLRAVRKSLFRLSEIFTISKT